VKNKLMSQMNKERDLKDGVITRAVSEPSPPGSPTAADLQALQDAGVDYADFLKIFFKGKKNDE